MFSGIVEELGRVARSSIAGDGRLAIAAVEVVRDVSSGDSIAVNGCCLTVVEADGEGFVVDVMPETARRTTLGSLTPGDPVNLEAALAYGQRVGGHLVTGHVDAVGAVRSLVGEGNAHRVTIAAPEQVLRYTVAQGSIAVDGISLTVVEVASGTFTVSLIPHTVAATRAQVWSAGTPVNLEADITAKYVERSVVARLAAAPPGS